MGPLARALRVGVQGFEVGAGLTAGCVTQWPAIGRGVGHPQGTGLVGASSRSWACGRGEPGELLGITVHGGA